MQPRKVNDGCEEFIFPKQRELQMTFVVTCVLCVPVMLFGKPLYTLLKAPSKGKRVSQIFPKINLFSAKTSKTD